MNIRTVKKSDYFSLSRRAVGDENLSYKALGIHTYLMSKPDNWEGNEADIAKRHTEGAAAVRTGIQELIQHGYIVRVQLRRNKKIVGWRLDTYETPELNPFFDPEAPLDYVVLDLDGENHNLGGQDDENLDVGYRNVGKLDRENLDVGNLDVGNRNHSNKRNTTNNEYQIPEANASGAERPPLPPLSKRFQELLEQLQEPKSNRPALLREIYLLCFGEREDAPDFGYLGKVAKDIGGAGLLAMRMWQLTVNPPAGDVLAYILAAHKGGGKGGSGGNAGPRRQTEGEMAVDRVFARLAQEQNL